MTNIAKASATIAKAATPAIGHNNPPDPVGEAMAPFNDVLAEAEHWLDGGKVEDEGQLAAVDHLHTGAKDAAKAIEEARVAASKPLHEAWQAENARWKPQADDLKRVVKGLAACMNGFKVAKAAAQAEAERLARLRAEKAAHAAKMAAMAADPANIEEQRRAARMADEAQEARHSASEAAQGRVKGLRAVTHHEITDMRSLVNWIATYDKDAMREFATEYARKHAKAGAAIDGVRIWTTKEAR
jgi:hypothetical protein